jgi:hypothetical protein
MFLTLQLQSPSLRWHSCLSDVLEVFGREYVKVNLQNKVVLLKPGVLGENFFRLNYIGITKMAYIRI